MSQADRKTYSDIRSNTERKIITSLTPTDLQQLQTNARNAIIVVKFGAEWCGPCKVIKPMCEEWARNCPPNIIYADIDIDESIELYMALKNKRMLRGVPTILAFNTNKQRDQWYIPDFSVEGGNVIEVKRFFDKCLN
jgi:thiol-disulfide isomerase/thioredoxin